MMVIDVVTSQNITIFSYMFIFGKHFQHCALVDKLFLIILCHILTYAYQPRLTIGLPTLPLFSHLHQHFRIVRSCHSKIELGLSIHELFAVGAFKEMLLDKRVVFAIQTFFAFLASLGIMTEVCFLKTIVFKLLLHRNRYYF